MTSDVERPPRETGPRPLHTGFLASAKHFSDRPALEVAGRTWTYAELEARASSIAAALAYRTPDGGPPLTAVFAYRSAIAFAGVLAALLRGHGYVPLNPTFPVERTRSMLVRSGARAVIIDATCEADVERVLVGVDERLLLIFADRADTAELALKFPTHEVIGNAELRRNPAFAPIASDPQAIAYLLFTSGSTGIPKGVMVSHANVAHFVDVMIDRYRTNERDRFSQMFDFTFDLSAFDLFVAWESGACIVCPSKDAAFMPYAYLQEANLSVWFSVPSIAVQMRRLRMLDPEMYKTLRISLFCGEALPAVLAEAWTLAAPNSFVENLYGPTEATIACAHYRWDPSRSPSESERGVVPIGAPLEGMSALVVDESLAEVAPGEAGELLMSGPQVSLGYWNDADKTALAFVVPPGKTERYYRTGDLVRRPTADGAMQFLGRADNQIKIRGYRVELGEVEAALREVCGVAIAVAVGFPKNESGAEGLVAFVGAPSVDAKAVKQKLKEKLPVYMVPAQVKALEPMPLNANGKVDRSALIAMLEVKKA
jgi:amino acid adenylation domain-containing protein